MGLRFCLSGSGLVWSVFDSAESRLVRKRKYPENMEESMDLVWLSLLWLRFVLVAQWKRREEEEVALPLQSRTSCRLARFGFRSISWPSSPAQRRPQSVYSSASSGYSVATASIMDVQHRDIGSVTVRRIFSTRPPSPIGTWILVCYLLV